MPLAAGLSTVKSFEALIHELGPTRACLIEYEGMHDDMKGCLTRLAKLLGPDSERILEEQGDEIMKALGFDVMKAEGASQHILRKGQAGGWTEHFSKEDEARLQEQLDARLPRTEASLAGGGRVAWVELEPSGFASMLALKTARRNFF